ncbi:MAG: sensor histidine kinase [Clostridia bacterium]|nr:sensor histidine kinase [Clostridia bacterium]
MRDVLSYLKTRLPFLIFYLFLLLLVPVFFFLFELQSGGYLLLLISLAFLCALIIDGARYLRRLREIRNLSLSELKLPPPSSSLQRELFLLIESLYSELIELKNALNQRNNAELEYYTLWAHQIKTPISAMRLLLQAQDDEQSLLLRQELFKIEQYADLALRYVRLNDFSADRIPQSCDLNAIVSACAKKYALLFVLKGVSLTIAPLPVEVMSDSIWLSFIIEQLLSNAVKYTSRGGGVNISYDGALIIADNGVGIRKEDLPRIFEKGFTGYNGRLEGRASGIGLYLCKRAAEGLSIDLRIESELHKGSRAILRFPAKVDAE